MRVVLVIVIMTLTLGLGYWPVLASARVEAPALDSIHMVDALAGWALTVTRESSANELLRTTDGGLQWTDVTPLNSSGQRIRVGDLAVLNSLVVWAESADPPNQIFHTIDGGRTWRSPTPVPMFQAYGNSTPYSVGGELHFVDALDGWLMIGVGAAGSMEVDVHRTTDGGQTWVKVAHTTTGDERSGLPFGGDKAGITFLNTTTGWITGYDLGEWISFYVTHDGGHTWRQQKLPLPPQVTHHWDAFTKPPTFFSAQEGILPVFYGIKNKSHENIAVFYATRDGGTHWTYTTPVPVSTKDPYRAQSFADANHGWVSDGDALHLTRDGGRRWTRIRLSSTFVDVVQLDFVSPQVGWAVRGPRWTSKRVPPFLFKTVDGGQTWAPVTYTVWRR